MKVLAGVLLILAGSAAAEGWTRLSGPEVRSALTDRKLSYSGGEVQTFYASGKTLYDAGRPSWGSWEVRGDQYCSTWPPSDLWACYDVTIMGDEVRFIDASGGHSSGSYTE